MTSKETWASYHSPGVVESDASVLEMLQETIDTIHSLERMYGEARAQMFVRALLMDYHALTGMASGRQLKNIPTL